MFCDLLEGLLVFPTTEFMYPELLLKHRKCWTTAVISMDRKTYRSDDIEKLSFFISLMCQNTVLQIKPVWLLPLKFSDSQMIQTFSKRYWHRYKQKKVKFAASTHLTCRICNLAVLCTSPVAWWSSTVLTFFQLLKYKCRCPIFLHNNFDTGKGRTKNAHDGNRSISFFKKMFHMPFCSMWYIPRTKAKSSSKVSSWAGDKSNPC